MRRYLTPLFASLVLLAAPGSGQDDGQPFFSLSSARTFAGGEPVQIEVATDGVDSLEFRVYQVRQPVQFFAQLEDPHAFGGQAARPDHKLSLLERLHNFKRSTRAGWDGLVRQQFSLDARHQLHATFVKDGGAKAGSSKVESYASVPVLNPEQLVSKWTERVQSANRWEGSKVKVPTRGKGVYLVEAVRGNLKAYTVVVVSDLAMIVRTDSAATNVFAVNRTTGAPIGGVQVFPIAKNVAGSPQVTAANGLAKLAAGADEELFTVATKDGDVAVSTLSRYGMQHKNQWAGLVYTDRPIYRPSHKVSFKAILRLHQPGGYRLPPSGSFQVDVKGPQETVVYQQDLRLSAKGTLADSFTLPKDAPLGYYTISVREPDGQQMTGLFQVEEYKKPEYEVTVKLAKPRLLQGESTTATIQARYFFGEPVAGAKVTYGIYRSRYWAGYFDNADEGPQPIEAMGEGGADEQVSTEEGRLDAAGKLQVKLPTTISDRHYDSIYRVEANVSDEGNRPISGTGYAVATYGSFKVNIETSQYVFSAGATAKFRLKAVDYEQKPIQTRVSVSLVSVGKGDGEGEGDPAVGAEATVAATTGADGEATVELPVPKGGGWRVIATATTPEGRQVRDNTYLWVTSGDASAWGGESERVQLIPDKKKYAPGDTAHILVVSGAPSVDALVTVEGAGIESIAVRHSNEPTFSIDVPIQATHVPNVQVAVQFIQGGTAHEGTLSLRVPPVAQKLKVTLTPTKTTFQPGEHATYALDVKDGQGRGVSADVSVGVVDEAIYAIAPDATEDLVRFFWGSADHRVWGDNSLGYYFRGEAGVRRMKLAGMRPKRTFAALKPEPMVIPKVRKFFPDTAFWQPDVSTDDSGHGKVELDFPDSLTTWRATARAATADTKVGSVVDKIVVRKNIILRLATPRFLIEGDEVSIGAIVHNYLTEAKTVKVSLEGKGIEMLDGAQREVTLPSRGDARVDFRVRAQRGKQVVLTGKALTSQESDALELPLPVEPAGVKLTMAKGGSLSGSASTPVTLTFPGSIAPGSRVLKIQVTPSLAGSVFGAMEYLTEFPYGCTEQTLSSFVPNVVVTKAMSDLKVASKQDPARLREKTAAGLKRLTDFQHEDGGWGWWKTDDSSLFMTASVVAGLGQAKGAGVEIDAGMLSRGVTWLKAAYAREPRMVADLKAYAVYSLAMASQSDGSMLGDAYANRSEMSAYGLALTGLALEQAADKRLAELVGLLKNKVKESGEEVYWPLERDSLLDLDVDSSPEATALAIKLLSHVEPASPLLPKAVLYLLNHRNEGYYWNSTKQTAMVIYGLTDYVKAGSELKPDLDATIVVNGREVLKKHFSASDALSPLPVEVEVADDGLAPVENRIQVQSKGSGRLYYSLHATYHSTEPKVQRVGSVALNVLRDYYRMTPSQGTGRIVYDLNPMPDTVKIGDLLAVRVTVTGGPWRYLLVEDPIPAGTEFVEKDQLYELRKRPDWWSYFFTQRERHDDRIALFRTYFSEGQQQYFYLLRVVNAGKFHINATVAQPMYQPSVLATAESRTLEAQ